MSDKYPHPCTHCGLCCLIQICPIGISVLEINEEDKHRPCPALEWKGEKSSCGLINRAPNLAKFFGSGEGCCISAQVVTSKGTQDFASLPETEKTKHVQNLLTSTANGNTTKRIH